MSDILIKGMEMPINEPLIVKINPDGSVSKLWRDIFLGYADCKAVPVPPHGDLIDRDILMDSDGDLWDGMWGWSGVQIANAPTIIPAEEGE